jgi:hypothetical protein
MQYGYLLGLLLLATPLAAQTVISGNVYDERGEAIPGANVFLVDTYDGTTTNVAGEFQFTTTETGKHILNIKFVGFKEFQRELILNGSPITLSVRLKEVINQLDAVTITAGAFAASDENRRTIFRAVDIATTAGATADIAGALNTLPGTQKVGESGRLFVRGGDGNEAKTFIDGMLVLDAYGPAAPNTPSRGRFLPFMFKGTSFSTGGYSAEYGQALSSALVLDSKDEEAASRTDIGILSVGGDAAHTQSWNGGSAAGKIQYTNIRPYFGLINQEIDWRTPPASIEGSGAFRQHTGKTGMIKVYGNVNHSSFSLYNHSIDKPITKTLFNLENNYQYLNGFYKSSINDRWSMRAGVSYTNLRNDLKLGDVTIDERSRGIHSKVVLEGNVSDRIELKSGLEIIDHDYQTEVDTSTIALGFHEIITAAFAETDLYASNKFVTRLGGRFEYNSLNQESSVDPRVSLAYKFGKQGQVSLAYGTFRQSPKNEWLRINNSLKPERADHYILNYQLVENKRTFRIETYYKQYHNLVKFDENTLTNKGNGYAKGVELFWRDNRSIRNVDYWISYSFLDTKRDYLNTPYSVVPSFASKHNFSVVYKHFISDLKTQVGFTYSYTSGRPYNNPNQERFNNSKTKSYQNLSVNISYLPTSQLILYVSCTNVLGRDNIFGYGFGNTLNGDGVYPGRAIRQPAPRFLFVGIFITLSKEKSMNQLPSL